MWLGSACVVKELKVYRDDCSTFDKKKDDATVGAPESAVKRAVLTENIAMMVVNFGIVKDKLKLRETVKSSLKQLKATWPEDVADAAVPKLLPLWLTAKVNSALKMK